MRGAPTASCACPNRAPRDSSASPVCTRDRPRYTARHHGGGARPMALTVVRGTLGRGDTDDTLDEERRALAEAGAEMVAVPVAERERVLELLPRADGLLGFSTIDGDMIGRLERCRGVVTVSHGFNHIDLDTATAAGDRKSVV